MSDPLPSDGRPGVERPLLNALALGLGLILLALVLLPLAARSVAEVGQVSDGLQVAAAPPVAPEPARVCADVCDRRGACRHIVVPPGWRQGQRLSAKRLVAAQACR